MADQITFQKLFSDFFSQQAYGLGVRISIGTILMNLIVSLAIALFIYYIYKKSFTGVMYNKNFSVTLVMTTLLVSGIMMTITGNLALSLGMVGALSIIRFRTAIKDPKDVTFLFWAVSVGIINGVSFFELSVTMSIFMGIVILLLSKKMPLIHLPFILMIKYTALDDAELEKILDENCSRFKVRNSSLSDSEGEKTIEVRVRKNQETKMLQEIKALEGVKKVVLFSHEGELAE